MSWKIIIPCVDLDTNWRPPDYDPPYIYVWGNQWNPGEVEPTVEYHVDGAKDRKYLPERVTVLPDWSRWKKLFPIDGSDFDFSWRPNPYEPPYIYVWGNQWNPGEVEPALEYHVPGAIDRKYMDDVLIIKKSKYNALYISHVKNNAVPSEFESKFTEIYQTEYQNSYLHTIGSWIKSNRKKLDNTHIWVISSICNYGDFDFTWSVPSHKFDHLIVFPSYIGNKYQKFGDTFLVNIDIFLENFGRIKSLDEYRHSISFMESNIFKPVPRIDHPVFRHDHDSQNYAVHLSNNIEYPYCQLIAPGGSEPSVIQPPQLWEKDNGKIYVYGDYGVDLVVPRGAGDILGEGTIYDWPNLDFVDGGNPQPLDIIFISNGESIAEENWEHLRQIVQDGGHKNRLKRVKNVNGRVNSQMAAAAESSTPWYFLINAKLRIDKDFNWLWQPNRLVAPMHYIFMAKNPVNGLVYGHQAIVANNKKLTLSTVVRGLDFTMDSPHDVVDMLSGVAYYNCDRWTAWRTAFREVIKLCAIGGTESIDRVAVWCTPGTGENASWSQKGAHDAVKFFYSDPSYDNLAKSYDWDWISDYFYKKYGNI